MKDSEAARKLEEVLKSFPGHAGREGQRGGSAPKGSAASTAAKPSPAIYDPMSYGKMSDSEKLAHHTKKLLDIKKKWNDDWDSMKHLSKMELAEKLGIEQGSTDWRERSPIMMKQDIVNKHYGYDRKSQEKFVSKYGGDPEKVWGK